jgi:hypothetical protein
MVKIDSEGILESYDIMEEVKNIKGTLGLIVHQLHEDHGIIYGRMLVTI